MQTLAKLYGLYKEGFPDGVFEQELAWHLSNGIVTITPDIGILAHYSKTDGKTINRDERYNIQECNCWYCSYAVGSVSDIVKYILSLPRQMEYIAFDRLKNNKTTTIIKTERFISYGKK